MRSTTSLFLIPAIAVQSACSIPGPRAAPEAQGAIQRSSIAVPTTPGREVSYLHAGKEGGPLLIYIHGTPGEAAAWTDYLADPVPGFESIAVDRPGFGESISFIDPRSGKPRHTAVPSFAEQADAIVPLLERRNGHGAILVGHSLGGPIAARLAADHPDLVSGLVILAGSLDPDEEIWAWYNELATWWILNWMIPDEMLTANAEVAQAKHETQLLAEVLPRIACPVVWVQGGKDDLVPPANAAYARRMMTSAAPFELIELPTAGHFLPWEHADIVRNAIQRVAELANHPTAPAPAGAPSTSGSD